MIRPAPLGHTRERAVAALRVLIDVIRHVRQSRPATIAVLVDDGRSRAVSSLEELRQALDIAGSPDAAMVRDLATDVRVGLLGADELDQALLRVARAR